MKGAWIVYDYNGPAYPIAIFGEELEAHRHREKIGYGFVKFWEFGTEWEN